MVSTDADLSDSILPGNPEDLMKSGKFNKDLEVIIGSTESEGLLQVLTLWLKWTKTLSNFDIEGPQLLFGVPNADAVTPADSEKVQKVLDFYNISADGSPTQGIEMFTDGSFAYGNYKTLNYLRKYGVKTYHYILTHQGQHSFSQIFGVDPIGVMHADDLIYLFKPTFSGDRSVSCKSVLSAAL